MTDNLKLKSKLRQITLLALTSVSFASLSFQALAEYAANPKTSDTKDSFELKSDGFYRNEMKCFIVGGNWRLIEYGQNFGSTAWFPKGNGVSKKVNILSDKLKMFKQAGIGLLRVGLLDDGRAMFDKEGNVIGFNDIFKNDVSTFLELAARSNIKVEFVIVDFLLAGRGEEANGVWLRGRRKVIEDPNKRSQFLDSFLKPFIKEFGNHPAIFGFDLINEPEWIIAQKDGGAWESVKDANRASTPVSYEEFKKFITQSSDLMHQLAPGKFVTMGTSCPYTGLVKEHNLDYYALHYYPWMGDLERNLQEAPKGKPWILEEFPGKEKLSFYLEKVFKAGGGGALLWNLSPGIDDLSYPVEDEKEKLEECKKFIANQQNQKTKRAKSKE